MKRTRYFTHSSMIILGMTLLLSCQSNLVAGFSVPQTIRATLSQRISRSSKALPVTQTNNDDIAPTTQVTIVDPTDRGLTNASMVAPPAPSRVKVFLAGTTLCSLVGLLAFSHRQAIRTTSDHFQQEILIPTLENLQASGPTGLLFYTLAFTLWEMTVGITTPLEAAAGMAFGRWRASLGSFTGKFVGAWLAFGLSRHRYAELVQTRMVETNELFLLIQQSIRQRPFAMAMLCRFAPLPEVVKNAGMGVMPVPLVYFLASILLHGGFFTVLWSCMGDETARVLQGHPPSTTLPILLSGATWIGLTAPVVLAAWIRSLRAQHKLLQQTQQQQQHQHSI
eukprot:Nitzschia sp. Nitz4//scaffold28_size193895//99158//100168//NITZ4_001660-RA/size193895-processed-gene-0.226-mRNA-1//1//CDS//3329545967//6232//frame0